MSSSAGQLHHHHLDLTSTRLHYVRSGEEGSPVLLVHGFPETWWTFHRLIPLLAVRHRVVAVDLRGFGDSDHGPGTYDSATSAGDLHELVEALGLGPVHLTGQDISGATVVRLASTHPADVRSLAAIEMGLPGFGLEALADVTRGGSWHIGVLAAADAATMLLAGRERAFLGGWAFPSLCATPGAVTADDVDEFVRTYAVEDGWRGAGGLYRSMLVEGDEIRSLVTEHPVTAPVLAVGAGGGDLTEATMRQVAQGPVQAVRLDGVGHYVALEAPERLADALLGFYQEVDAGA